MSDSDFISVGEIVGVFGVKGWVKVFSLTDPRENILSYSPYDNIIAQAYPNLLVTSGLHDSQVQYWEPTKWVAKLRDYNTGDGMILLHTNMEAGHGGASGRFRRLRETARKYAFMLDLAGIRK